MVQLVPILKKSYWLLAGLGGAWALFLLCLTNPTIQRHALYAHKANTGFLDDVTNPEEFGFAKGQVTPFNLTTSDGETLFCWHVLPLDVYLDNENEIVQKASGWVDDLKETVSFKLLQRDPKSKVVINFHGNAGHVAQGFRPSTYRSISGIPHTHLLTCDYRGFGLSTLKNAPHIPTEPGLITDGISMISYVLSTLQHPSDRTLLLGQSFGTAVASASALYFTDPSTKLLPPNITPPSPAATKPTSFAGLILVAPFPDLPTLLQTYKISGIFPVLSPLRGYPRLSRFFASRILDQWPTLARLQALISAPAAKSSMAAPTELHVSLLHARNDQDIDFRLSEALYASLETVFLGAHEGAQASEERRSIQGGERVRRGAFAYRSVEDALGERSVEMEVVRYGGHNEVVGWTPVALAVRRGFKGRRRLRPGLDVE